MRILMPTAQKGGCGKTNLASCLAVAARQDGEQVVLVDLDPQASLTQWNAQRGEDGFVIRPMSAADFGGWLEQMRNVSNVSLVVVDTPGSDGPDATLAYPHADFCLVPALPSVMDLRANGPTVRRLNALNRPFAFVLNGVSQTSLARTIDATAALQAAGVVAPVVGHRLVFRDAFAAGLGATEFDPSSKASDEIRRLWTWVKEKMTEHGDAAA